MPSDPSAPIIPPGSEARRRLAWQALPASLGFFLDLVAIGRSHRDVVDSLLFGAIFVANIAALNRDPDVAHAYAAVDSPSPDELRRPVSINAIAQSLRLPFETTRRRVRRMAKDGVLIVGSRGVYVPAEAVGTPDFVARAIHRHERLGRFYAQMLAMGVVSPESPPTPLPVDAAPVRLTNRELAGYMLRVVNDIVSLTGDPISALVFMQMARENTAHLPESSLASWTAAPLRVARPMRIAGLAKGLRLSTETTRRHVLALEGNGFCARTAKGFIAVTPRSAAPQIAQLVDDNLANVQRLFARLRQLGVLSVWET